MFCYHQNFGLMAFRPTQRWYPTRWALARHAK